METINITRQVQWRDLTKLNLKEICVENTITIPWVILSWGLAYYEYYWLALPFSSFFFLTGLRQVHNGFHNALGTNKFLTWGSLYLNSILMVASIHAVKYNHIRHHKYCMGDEDYEGKSARMTWYGAMLYGPIHIFLIHKITWQLGDRKHKINMLAELISIILFIGIVFTFNIHFLMYHIFIMLIGEFMSAFFAVWTVHHHLEDGTIARTQRSVWKNVITYSMFYHLEHHLFPAVPTIKLPELARRIDASFPDLEKKTTF